VKKVTSVTRKGQVTIPLVVREKLGIAYGDKVEFSFNEEGEVLLKPVKTDINRLYGILSGQCGAESEEQRKQAREWVAGRQGRDK
jgi:AbrB family looped-hinge helix DNA binding protein